MNVHELTDVQNACLEAAHDAVAISAADVVSYVKELLVRNETATISRSISKIQASRALRQLSTWGMMRREPRTSRGWGRGWESSCYSLVQR